MNPFDVEGVAVAIERAATMSPGERRLRMRRLRRSVREHSVFVWLDSFLEAAVGGSTAGATVDHGVSAH